MENKQEPKKHWWTPLTNRWWKQVIMWLLIGAVIRFVAIFLASGGS